VKQYHFFLFLLFTSIYSCAPSRHIETLEKNEKSVGISLGGPLINFSGAVMPIPFTSIGGGYGLKEGFTVFGYVHTTSLLFYNLQTDIGCTKRLLNPHEDKKYIPGISVSTVANTLFDFKSKTLNFYPQIDVNSYWKWGKKNNRTTYVGIDNWFELKSKKAHNEPQQTHWVFNPHIGQIFHSKNWSYSLEMKYLAPNHSNKNLVVEYTPITGKNGATGIYVGISRRF
jgi:hypothetical protein